MRTRQHPPGEAAADTDDGGEWVSVSEAVEKSGASKQAIRNWYRKEIVPSRVVDSIHGPMRLVHLPSVIDRVERWRREAQPKRAQRADLGADDVIRLAERAADALERLAEEREQRAKLESRIAEMQRVVDELRAEKASLERRLSRAKR